MRIEGYIEHPNMKITVFKMDNRYSVKFETSQYEQTYKLRRGGNIENMEDVKKWFDDSMMQQILQHFNHMHQISMSQLAKMNPVSDDEFETII